MVSSTSWFLDVSWMASQSSTYSVSSAPDVIGIMCSIHLLSLRALSTLIFPFYTWQIIWAQCSWLLSHWSSWRSKRRPICYRLLLLPLKHWIVPSPFCHMVCPVSSMLYLSLSTWTKAISTWVLLQIFLGLGFLVHLFCFGRQVIIGQLISEWPLLTLSGVSPRHKKFLLILSVLLINHFWAGKAVRW